MWKAVLQITESGLCKGMKEKADFTHDEEISQHKSLQK